MIDEDAIRRIRNLRAEHWPIKAIAQKVGVARNTVKRYLRLAEQQERGEIQADAHPRRSKGFPERPRRRRGDAKSIHGHLLRRGEVVSYSRVARKLRKELLEDLGTGELHPGQRAEVNWGRVSLGHTWPGRKTLIIFTMQLSWSKAVYIEMSPNSSVGVFAQCHINAFNYFGGIPRRCLYPRRCRIALEWYADGRPTWNPGMKLMAAWTGFQPECWLPYMQAIKGRLPNPIEKVQDMLTRRPAGEDITGLNLWVNNNFLTTTSLGQWIQSVRPPIAYLSKNANT